jgi:hypothetical protein
MKLRYLVLVTLVAATLAACGQSPTAPSATRSPGQVILDESEVVVPSGTGAAGSGH